MSVSRLLKGSSVSPGSVSGDWIDTILKGDCVAALDRLPDHSVDLVFADPP